MATALRDRLKDMGSSCEKNLRNSLKRDVIARKISVERSQKQTNADLAKYRDRALQLGATDARIITSDAVIVDERVPLKCKIPPCPQYGSSANCPPYTLGIEETIRLVNKYNYGIFTKIEIPSWEIAGGEAKDRKLYRPWYRKLYKIVSSIEAEAFYDGYYLAVGFACGSCKTVFCEDSECRVLLEVGTCRFPLRARPSMEAVGMDAFAMAEKIGWDIYPIGGSVEASEVPSGSCLGLVLIY